jgi:hypothetical protein
MARDPVSPHTLHAIPDHAADGSLTSSTRYRLILQPQEDFVYSLLIDNKIIHLYFKSKNSVAFIPQAGYTGRADATCRRT